MTKEVWEGGAVREMRERERFRNTGSKERGSMGSEKTGRRGNEGKHGEHGK